MKMIKKLAGYFIGFALPGIVLAVTAFVLLTSRAGWEYDAIISGSMEPLYHVGGLVVIKPVDPARLQVGDVISFKYPDVGTPICHRVIDIKDTASGLVFTTKGDSNGDADPDPVAASMVNGRAVTRLPYIGRVADLANAGRERMNVFGRSLPRAVVIVIIIGFVFIFLTLKDTLESIRHPERERCKALLKRRQALLARRKKLFNLS